MRKDLDDKEIVKLYESGLSLMQIASKLKCHHATVWRKLRKSNVKCRPSPHGRQGWLGRAATLIQSLSPEQLQQLVDKHSTIQGIMKEIHVSHDTHWTRLFRAAVARVGIDFSKFRRGRVPEAELFCKNSTYKKGNGIKILAFKRGLLEKRCYICGMGPIWNNQPLVLALDHINGDRHDNRLENLRCLCPNCHSQTPTYNRNLKSRRKQI